MGTNSRRGKVYQGFSSQISVTSVRMASQDISNWKNAIDSARSEVLPRRRLLLDLYDIIKLDGHLEAVMEKRNKSVVNKRIQFIKKSDPSTEDEWITENILQAPWFYDLREYAGEEVPFGFSLIELVPDKGYITSVVNVMRQNVMPEYLFLAKDFSQLTPDPKAGWFFEQDESVSDYLLFCGKKKSYGKLMTAAQYVIYKRGGFGDWAQFAEIFGMPFRDAEYDPYDETTRTKLETALSTAGGAGWMIRPKGTSLTLHDANQSGKAEVFDLLIDRCNSEISKIFLGQTMTTDDGASRSQGQIHKAVEEEILVGDMIKMEYLLNWKLKKKLVSIGYPLAEGNFSFPETSEIPLEKRIDIDMKLARLIDMDEEYFYKTYGVVRPKDGSNPVRLSTSFATPSSDPVSSEENKQPDDPEEKGTAPKKGEKKKLNHQSKPHKVSLGDRLRLLYKHSHNSLLLTAASSEEIWKRLADAFHERRISAGYIDPELYKWTRDELVKGLTKGFGGGLSDFDSNDPDGNLLSHLHDNVQLFSGFKTYHQLREATDLLTGDDGKLRDFTSFRNDVLKLDKQYNVTYLNAEYNLAVSSSQMASRWVDIEKQKETLPMLTFRTSGGDNVCPICSKFDGLTFPVDHDFWDENYPPLHPGCVCDVDQSDDAQESRVDISSLPELPDICSNNAGKTGVVFPSSHPYFDVSKEEKSQIEKFVKEQENADKK